MPWNFNQNGAQNPRVTLQERLQYVVNQGWVGSRTQWSLRAGLSKGVVSHIINGVSRDPKAATLLKLARTAGVSASWLISDIGGPKDPEPADFDVYPMRQALIEVLALEPENTGVIQKLRSIDIYETDPGLDDWVRIAHRLLNEKPSALEEPRRARLALPKS